MEHGGSAGMRVGEVAASEGVTVRTLHHYDHVGLLRPSLRTAAGYRLYGEQDVARLRTIRTLREFGFSLSDIARLLELDPRERARAFARQRDRLEREARRTQAQSWALDGFLRNGSSQGEALTPESEAPDESRWERLIRETESIERAWSHRMGGAAPDDGTPSSPDPESHPIAEAHRALIERWYYPFPPARMSEIADLLEQDPSFRSPIDRRSPGLARFIARELRRCAAAAPTQPAHH